MRICEVQTHSRVIGDFYMFATFVLTRMATFAKAMAHRFLIAAAQGHINNNDYDQKQMQHGILSGIT